MRKLFANKTRVYSQRSYRNPFFQRRRRRVSTISWKLKIFVVLTVLMLSSGLWFVFYHDFFNVKNIEIIGSENIRQSAILEIADEQLAQKKFFILNQKNIFSLSKKQLKNEILKKYYVIDLKINRELPGTIVISFTEKQATAIWLEDDIYYYIDSDLNIISKIESLDIDIKNFIVMTNNREETLIEETSLSKKISIDQKYLGFATKLASKLNINHIDHEGTFYINNLETTVDIKIIDGPVVHFNVENDLDSQFTSLKTLLDEEVKGDHLKKLEYIDLRFGEKIYYK
ncbi:MAG: FtsQ-type POTRA domain-containing protein [bacterium]|nr:FtsQ-type POTRA domain-containing protein [bacterium]